MNGIAVQPNAQTERDESEIGRSLKRDAVERNRAGERPTEAEIDRILEQTFPASDPPSWTLGLVPRDTHAAQQRLVASSSTTNGETRNANQNMKIRNIIMSAADHAELRCVIASGGKLSERTRAELKGLESELERAQIVAPEAVPPNVITLNSRAELLDLDTGERMEFTLVFPSEANIDDGKISVLEPLGTRCSATELAMSSSGPCPTACGG